MTEKWRGPENGHEQDLTEPPVAHMSTREQRIAAWAETGDTDELEVGDYPTEELGQYGLKELNGKIELDSTDQSMSRSDYLDWLRTLGVEIPDSFSHASPDEIARLAISILNQVPKTSRFGREHTIVDTREAALDLIKSEGAAAPIEVGRVILSNLYANDGYLQFQQLFELLIQLPSNDEERKLLYAELEKQESHRRCSNVLRQLYMMNLKEYLHGDRDMDERDDPPLVQLGKDQYGVVSEDGHRMYVVFGSGPGLERAIKENDTEKLDWIAFNTLDEGWHLRDMFPRVMNGYEGSDKLDEDATVFFFSTRTQAFLEEELGHNFAKELSFREAHFVQKYLEVSDYLQWEALVYAAKKHGLDVLRACTAAEEDLELVRDLSLISYYLPEDVGRKFYKKYVSFVDVSEGVAEEVEVALRHYDEAASTNAVDTAIKTARSIRKRGNELLRSTAEQFVRVERDRYGNEDPNSIIDQLESDLDHVIAESTMQAEMFRALVKNGELKAEHLGFEAAVVKGSELDEEDLKEMRALFERNYRNESREFREKIMGSFESALAKNTTDFYTLRNPRGDVVAFSRLDHNLNTERERESIYFGSFNVEDMNSKGSGIGSYMLRETLTRAKAEAEEAGVPIEAHCDPGAFITQKYIEWGFVATEIADVAGKPSFSIRFDPGQHYEGKTLTEGELAAKAHTLAPDNESLFIYRTPAGEEPDWSPLSRGFVLTRFVRNSEGELVTVFERAQERGATTEHNDKHAA